MMQSQNRKKRQKGERKEKKTEDYWKRSQRQKLKRHDWVVMIRIIIHKWY